MVAGPLVALLIYQISEWKFDWARSRTGFPRFVWPTSSPSSRMFQLESMYPSPRHMPNSSSNFIGHNKQKTLHPYYALEVFSKEIGSGCNWGLRSRVVCIMKINSVFKL